MFKRSTCGFTLSEILIVIAIIATLACITIPRFSAQTERARAAEAAGILGAIRQGEMAYKLDTGSYLATPADAVGWAKLGLDNPNTSKWVYTIDGGTGTSTATKQVNPNATTTITLTATGTWGGTHPNVPSN